jgi:hypothetical protein
MRTVPLPGEILKALEREKARRHFEALAPAELDAEIRKHLIDISTVALERLIGQITADPIQQEVQLRHVERVADDLAGPNPKPTVKFLARSAAVLILERDFADVVFFRTLDDPNLLESAFGREVRGWRALVHRKLNSAIRTLAYVRHVDAATVEHAIDRLKIAS